MNTQQNTLFLVLLKSETPSPKDLEGHRWVLPGGSHIETIQLDALAST